MMNDDEMMDDEMMEGEGPAPKPKKKGKAAKAKPMDMSKKKKPKNEMMTLNDTLKKYMSEANADQSKLIKRIDRVNNFYTGDEWELADGVKPQNGNMLSLKLPKRLVETFTASVLENEFDPFVTANELPEFDEGHPFRQMLNQAADELFLAYDDARVISELATTALKTLWEQLKVQEKLEHGVEKAQVDASVWFKDGVDVADPNVLTLKVVSRKELLIDKNAKSLDDLQWLCHKIPTTKQELLNMFPDDAEVIEKYAEDDEDSEGETQRLILEEHWIRDCCMVEDEDGVLCMKYPGGWKQAYRVGDHLLLCRPNPFDHGRLPFHPLIAVTDPAKPLEGISLVGDVLFGLCVGMNQITSLALWNLLLTSNNKRVVNLSAILNPEAVTDNSISNLKLKDGEQLSNVVLSIEGQQVSPAFFQVASLLQGFLSDTSGKNDMAAPGSPATLNDVVRSGFSKGLFRRRVKACLESISVNLISNLIQYVDADKSWRLMGGVGLNYIQFNPASFRTLVEDFATRFDIEIADTELMPTSAVERANLVTTMLEVAGKLSQLTGLKLSAAINLLPNMPGKGAIARQVERQEIEASRNKQPSPDQMAIMQQEQKDRKSASFEVTKKTLQKIADSDTYVASVLNSSEIQDRLFQLEQMPLVEARRLYGELYALWMITRRDAFAALAMGLELKINRQAELEFQAQAQAAQAQGVALMPPQPLQPSILGEMQAAQATAPAPQSQPAPQAVAA